MLEYAKLLFITASTYFESRELLMHKPWIESNTIIGGKSIVS